MPDVVLSALHDLSHYGKGYQSPFSEKEKWVSKKLNQSPCSYPCHILQNKWACASEWQECSTCIGSGFGGKVWILHLGVVNGYTEPGGNRPFALASFLSTSTVATTASPILLKWLVSPGVKHRPRSTEGLLEHPPPAASSFPPPQKFGCKEATGWRGESVGTSCGMWTCFGCHPMNLFVSVGMGKVGRGTGYWISKMLVGLEIGVTLIREKTLGNSYIGQRFLNFDVCYIPLRSLLKCWSLGFTSLRFWSVFEQPSWEFWCRWSRGHHLRHFNLEAKIFSLPVDSVFFILWNLL